MRLRFLPVLVHRLVHDDMLSACIAPTRDRPMTTAYLRWIAFR